MRNNHGRKERAPFQFCLPTTEPEFPLIKATIIYQQRFSLTEESEYCALSIS
jgi:hypothetical protein